MIVRVSLLHPGDPVAAWGLHLAATAQHLQRPQTTLTSAGKDLNLTLQVHFLLNAYHFYTIIKLKTLKWNHPKSGTVLLYLKVLLTVMKATNSENIERKGKSKDSYSKNSKLILPLGKLMFW